jgi:hypothetical protein
MRAVNQQLADHFIPAYAYWFRRMKQTSDHWSASAFASLDGIDPLAYDPCFILDRVPNGELGSHQNVLGIVTARALAQGAETSITLSHEAIEWRADRPCNIWIRQPDGSGKAFEPCDPVERTDYPISVTMFGITRTVQVSNFVLPNWFIPGSEGPWDYLGRLDGPGKILSGCHVVSQEMDGSITTAYGRGTSPVTMAQAIAHPLSRTFRRAQGGGQMVDFKGR